MSRAVILKRDRMHLRLDAMTKRKLERAAAFAHRLFPDHVTHVEFWAPNVPLGKTTEWFTQHVESSLASGVEVTFVINAEYTQRLQALVNLAAKDTRTPSEPAYRLLQILTHTRGGKLTL